MGLFKGKQGKLKVLMIGPARSVHGGISAMVNNFYAAGLGEQVKLSYVATMVDGGKGRKLIQAIFAYFRFLTLLPFYQILHVNMAADASYYRKKVFIDTAWIFKRKILIHEHGGDFEGFYYHRSNEKQRLGIQKTFARAGLVLVLSESWKEFFTPIVDANKIHVLQNGILIPDQGKKDYSGHSVLFLGRICKEKGIGELLEAVPAIQKAVPDFQLILGGVWEDRNERLKEKVKDFSQLVHCPGWVSGQEKEKYMEECSIFVLPSWFEGQPVSLLEAMAAGMCIVATAVGGIPQVIGLGDDETGILLPPESSETLAEILIMLLKDEGKRRRMGQNARQRIMERYNISKNVESLTEYYNTLRG